MAIYNMAGQRVATMIDAPRPAGMYTLMWDGTDAAGQPLASGIYLYQLRTGEMVQSRKLLLLR